jgi:hypothetical protein
MAGNAARANGAANGIGGDAGVGTGPSSRPHWPMPAFGHDEYVHAVQTGQGRDRRRGRRSRSCSRDGSHSTCRRTRHRQAARRHRAVSKPAPRQPEPVPVLRPRAVVRGRGASPELLVQVDRDKLTTHPIAGTRPRGATPAEDAILAEQLQRDPKERAEHVMLVDLGRNDLGRVARPGT